MTPLFYASIVAGLLALLIAYLGTRTKSRGNK